MPRTEPSTEEVSAEAVSGDWKVELLAVEVPRVRFPAEILEMLERLERSLMRRTCPHESEDKKSSDSNNMYFFKFNKKDNINFI